MGKKGIRVSSVEQLRRLLRGSPFRIEMAFLFGSRARGDFLEESDWDMLIVSPDFAEVPFPDRATVFLRKVPLRRVELFCYTPKEFSERVQELGIVREATSGIRIV